MSGTPRHVIRSAEVIAVGSELLTPWRIDTNSLFITERLNEIGVSVRAKIIVGDDREDLAGVFAQALERADLVVLTGGLGPTEDDVNREVVAKVLGLALEENAVVLERIARRFRSRGLRMPEINRRQAHVPHGAVVLDNPNGTAPGLWVEQHDKVVVLLPGPPREMKPMFERIVREHIEPRACSDRLYRRVLKIVGRSESYVDEAAQPIYARWTEAPSPISTTILAAPGQIELHLTARAHSEHEGLEALDRATAEIVTVLGSDVYSTDGRQLEAVVGDMLRAERWRIAVAESCTGGLLCSRLTDVPGSSDYVDRAVVCYSNQAKTDLLGVPVALMEAHGAVSEHVATAMAEGLLARVTADIAAGVTGIAGPTGGSETKPVGTVAIAAAWREGARVKTFRFPGGREQVKFHASQAALDMVRRVLLERQNARGER